MALKLVQACDRCGKEREPESFTKLEEEGWRVLKLGIMAPDQTLCPECQHFLVRFIDAGKYAFLTIPYEEDGHRVYRYPFVSEIHREKI